MIFFIQSIEAIRFIIFFSLLLFEIVLDVTLAHHINKLSYEQFVKLH